jgi:hypothetical protein
MSVDETTIKQKVISKFPDDDLRADEIVLDPGGDIIIDRRKTKPWAEPIVVGRWKG